SFMKTIRTGDTADHHIISRKHGGRPEAENLAYACLRCNAWKGSDIGSLDAQTGSFVSLFHPRQHLWGDHFVLHAGVIEPLTAEGKATVRLLSRLHLAKRAVERRPLAGRHPSHSSESRSAGVLC